VIASSTNQQHQTEIAPNLNHKAIASNIPTFTTQAIAPKQIKNTKQRSSLIPIKQRSPKISTLSRHKRSPLNKPTTPISDRP
jgi:dihydrodipicolinate synthase/N-acetylneuraminate lyase